jgi:predicted DNA binding protein
MHSSLLNEVEISIKRNDCRVSNVLSKYNLKSFFINLTIGNDESLHLLELGKNYKDIIVNLRREGVKVYPLKRDKIIALSTSSKPCRAFAKLNSVVLLAELLRKNVVVYRLLADRQSIKKILKELDDEGIEHSVLKMTPYVTLSGLTPRQSNVVQFALINGYFDVRRRVTLSTIARNFSIKPSTADLILRRALKKLVESYILRKI